MDEIKSELIKVESRPDRRFRRERRRTTKTLRARLKDDFIVFTVSYEAHPRQIIQNMAARAHEEWAPAAFRHASLPRPNALPPEPKDSIWESLTTDLNTWYRIGSLEMASAWSNPQSEKTQFPRTQSYARSDESAAEQKARFAEAEALSNPAAFELLAWLYCDGKKTVPEIFDAFDANQSFMAAFARLFLVRAIKLGQGAFDITPLGVHILECFEIIESE